MDVIGNNIANVNTVGYKSSRTTFADMLSQSVKGATGTNGTIGGTNPLQVGLGLKVSSIDLMFQNGAPRVTGKNTDLCLSGDGLFVVKGGADTYYTRDGAFTITEEGYLVTKDGDYVLNQAAALSGDPSADGYIQLDPTLDTVIDKYGYIFQNDTLVAQLGVVDFEDYDYISKYGENMYDLVDGGTIIDSDAEVYQGYIESSNISVVREMVEMIQIQRAYETNQKVIQTADAMTEVAVTQVGKV